MDHYDVCEFCAVRDNQNIAGAGSGCKTFLDVDGSFYSMCRVCADQEKVVNFCKACDVGCLFDNTTTHGFCEECYELAINGDEYHDLMVEELEKVKDEYDALAREVNAALGLPADDGTFATLDACEEDKISVVADKLCDVVLEKFPELHERTLDFYRAVDRRAVERCTVYESSDGEGTEETEDGRERCSVAKKQRTS